MINWKIRIKNKIFWITAVPAVLLLVQATAALAGFSLNLDAVGDKIITVINAAFVLLAMLGIVADPTTAGAADSAQALEYAAPEDGKLKATYIEDRRDLEDK